MHVAITRARHRCAVLADEDRRSPFLAELRGEAKEAATKPKVSVEALGRSTARSRARMESPLSSADAAPEAGAADAALREWRITRSNADGVPAYVVLSNRQLEGIAAAMPTDERELLACNGIGPTKLERYGDEILAVLEGVRGAQSE
jgi:DNA helicase-2/ATP-dependent DNA helicase PcrA